MTLNRPMPTSPTCATWACSLGWPPCGRSDPGWDDSQIAQLHACVLDAVAGYDYPVLAGVECTHSAPLLTLPIGVLATVDDEELAVEEAAVS